MNSCAFSGLTASIWAYVIVAVVYAGSLIFDITLRLRRSIKPTINRKTLTDKFKLSLWLTTSALIFLQLAGNLIYLRNELNFYLQHYAPDIEEFAKFCRRHIPKSSQADLTTDWDISQDPGMYYHRFLAYQLYPIDIRGIRKKEGEYLIVFDKKNPQASVPENFKIIATWKDNGLVAQRLNNDLTE